MLVEDRRRAREAGQHPLPGQAEFLDLLRTVTELSARGAGSPEAVLELARPFVFRKGESI